MSYNSQLLRHIIDTIKPLPSSGPVVQALLTGDPRAIKAAYDLARRHGLVLSVN